MKVSELWMRDWVNPGKTGEALAAQLTMAGLEVDAITPVAGSFDKVVVAKVLSTARHPAADKLTLCEVDKGSNEVVKIVCGASNVRPGLMVALATLGATLPNGLVIKEAKLRGELSQGMLCSSSELGLCESSEGILELEENAPLGMDFREYLQLDDVVFDIDLTPNRADCFSVLGVSREVAVENSLSFTLPSIESVTPTIDDTLTLSLQEPMECPIFYGRVIRGINIHSQTPVWMKERLRRAGVRLIHPVVDVTNYVMMELGQPMHAFDLSKIEGGLCVRLSRQDEQLTLLDGQTITFNKPLLVVSDNKKALSIAGIMGGADSQVTEDTLDIYLECAYFNPVSIALVARQLGLSSDSSMRFERGVDYTLQLRALERASTLLQAISGGQFGPVSMVIDETHAPKKTTIDFNPEKVKQMTGLNVSFDEMKAMLSGLGMTVDMNGAIWHVTAPAHRFDIKLDVDLVEEIARLYGYDKLESQPIITSVKVGTISLIETLVHQLGRYFESRGFNETISYSFVDPDFQQLLFPNRETMRLINPISSELSDMRLSLWPGLLASMIYNLNRQQASIKLFETGVIFNVVEGKQKEIPVIAGLMTGISAPFSWNETTRPFDFYDLKGDLEAMFTLLKIKSPSFEKVALEPLHPGQSANIVIDGKVVGVLGVLHPRLAEALDVSNDVILFELSLELLLNQSECRYLPISKYPQIRRDLSFFIDKTITAQSIERVVREAVNIAVLKQFDVFDVFVGENVPTGFKSIAISVMLQDNTKTLVEAEINLIISAILKKLGENFNIQLRE